MSPTTKSILTPNEAAQLAGCGRSSVMRAIRSGGLPATRDNRNAWTLRREDVERWAGQRPTTEPDTDRAVAAQVPAQEPDVAAQVEVAVLRVRLEAAETRAAELERERDRWHELATRPRPTMIGRILAHLTKAPAPSPSVSAPA